MLTFISVFLGLVLGVQPVELAVEGNIAAVEIQLDGKSIGYLRAEPWSLACDFGSELAPHELLAIGFDENGREVARVSQWLNLPQPRSRAELMIDDGDGRDARLLWQSADGAEPDGWEIHFDGERLDVDDPEAFRLPAYDAADVHVLQAELRFGRSSARTERVVGSHIGDAVETGLTVFVAALNRGKLPTVDEAQGWLMKGGEPLEVVSVEQGASDIVLVQEATPRLWGKLNKLRGEVLGRNRSFISHRLTSGLNQDDRLRVILPVGERIQEAAMEQFPISHDFGVVQRGRTFLETRRGSVPEPKAHGLLATLPYPREAALREDAPRRIADAVAVAAQAASAAHRSRAVVLVTDLDTQDLSANRPVSVRRYLQQLQVPFLVWSPESLHERSTEAGDWGEAFEIGTAQELKRAVMHLREVLDRQVVIWVRGRHLPQDIELAAAASPRLSSVASEVPLPDLPESPDIETWTAGAQDSGLSLTPPIDRPDLGLKGVLAAEETASTDAAIEKTAEVLESSIPAVLDTVDVRLVNVRAVVTDREGRRVRHLKRDDFELFENGEPVEITHFVAPAQDRAESETVAEPEAVDESSDERSTETAAEFASESIPRLVIFYDGLNIDLSGRRQMAESLREMMDRAGPMEIMLLTYDRTLKVSMPFSTDKGHLQGLLGQLEDGELIRAPRQDFRRSIANEIAAVEAALNARDPLDRRMAESQRSALLSRLRTEAQTLAADIRSVVAALRRVTAGLSGIEGAKALLYVGDSLELLPAFELYDEAIETLQLSPMEMADLRGESGSLVTTSAFEALADDANANGVTFYSLTPRNRGRSDVVERSSISISRPGSQMRMASARQEQVKEAACLLSGESGGLCQAGGAEPRLLLDQALEDVSSFYSLAFTPEHPADGEFHRLEVKVRDSELKTRHREGYRDRPVADRLQDRLAAALYFGVEDDALGMALRVLESEPSSGQRRSLVPLEVRVAVERLGLIPLELGSKLGAKARLLVTTRNAEGEVTGVQEFPITFQVAVERLRAEPPLVYAHKVHLMLEPGEHTVAIGLWDDVGGIGSFRYRRVSLPLNG